MVDKTFTCGHTVRSFTDVDANQPCRSCRSTAFHATLSTMHVAADDAAVDDIFGSDSTDDRNVRTPDRGEYADPGAAQRAADLAFYSQMEEWENA